MITDKLFSKYRAIGIVGDTGEGKSSLGLSEIVEIKKNYPNINVYALGVEPCLYDYLKKNKISILNSKEDILDLKIKDAIIFIDEFGDLFRVQTSDRQLDRIKRFFNRIEHLNDYVIISSAQADFWNKFMCGLVRVYLVKGIDFANLVNGTPLKRRIMGITENTSEYRLEVSKNEFFVIDDDVVRKRSFVYNRELDSKRDDINPFKKSEGKK